ncbi:MAG: virulence RhuM family protein [Candidatus Hydrogenedentes bacterium]|nr:virulence RhuM family protein [Candidatus Hydrogenedentota bacterium]
MTSQHPGDSPLVPSGTGEFLLYQTEDGRTRIECRCENETIWLTQALMAELFQTSISNVNIHLKAIYRDGELSEAATIKDCLIVQTEGGRQVKRRLLYYELSAILAVGYRIRSPRGVQFRQWATERLREYLVKGFTMDDERLKNPPSSGAPDYFDELLERIRDIRASERRMYLRLREILALAADYDPKEEDTQIFFQTVQNKLHFAVTGKTAPELIAERADHTKPNMGLTTWKGPIVRIGDVTVAKNYLNEQEITELNRVVTMFLDFAEDQARRRRQIFMRDWRERLDSFLQFNERSVLPDAGAVSREHADSLARAQYAEFEARRRTRIEREAEEEALKQLEDAARRLPKKK